MKRCPDIERVTRLYVEDGLTLREIGRLYGVSRGPVTRWLRQASIPIRPKHVVTGGIHSPEHEHKLRESRRGANSHWWRGGVSSEAMRYRASKEWATIRRSVYERDGWLCQDCGARCLNTRDSKSQPKLKIQCHHIIPRRLGGLDEPGNLVTLCMSCHHKRERRFADALIV